MDGLEHFIYAVDAILDSKRKRHIVGGILMSISTLLGGLAITVMTIRNDHEEEEEYEEYE